MAKRKQNNQTNQYDKIFRENMEAALPGIMEHLLGLHIVSSEELPDDVQHTKERRPDLLKKVTDNTGKIYVLHMEYQAKNDMDMAYRMAEYSIMLQRKYRLDVKQYVIFIGMGKSRMPQSIQSEDFHFKYHLMALSAIDYKIFLKSDRPEEKILAILANFEQDGAVLAIKSILQEVKSFAGSDLAEDRYFNQLRMLVQLRNLETQFDEAMEAITKFFKEEKDPFFRRGEAKGREEGIKETALKMKKSGLEISLIANITGLSVEEVEKL
ncbi:MAG: hypothetical protein ABIN91_19480 [Mucilaginibacter sp.]|jgi:predicted transposase YdaD|uniref:hypothetical protein n=1 Tax=Mucilaginibacter sp. TaxID=1882438 RepID=UPI0032639609